MKRLLVLGAGYTGSEVIRRGVAAGLEVVATARRAEQANAIAAQGARPLVMPELDQRLSSSVDRGTHVVITFPPDGVTDARVLEQVQGAGAITYISSTGVYGDIRGRIDDATPLPELSVESAPRLLAEDGYRRLGATVLRCPGIYGSDRGLHRRILRGEYAMPGDGSSVLSRIHVYDLASFILASPKAPGETFVVGDLEPATHREVASWICKTYGVPFPVATPLAGVHRSLRANRAVDSQRARRVLGVELRYPTYREGMAK
jgi:nucleoside-diphosphate-sugar epimerase